MPQIRIPTIDEVSQVVKAKDLPGSLKLKTIKVTDQELKSSANPTFEIVQATESLSGDDFPTVLPVPLLGWVVLNTLGGAYSNVHAEAQIALAWGDAEADLGNRCIIANELQDVWVSVAHISLSQFFPLNGPILTTPVSLFDDVESNALTLYLSNPLGPLDGGHPDNYLLCTVAYMTLGTI